MEGKCQNSDFDAKCLLAQLNTARKEINNLRQQIRSLRYVHEKDVESIKRLLGSCKAEEHFSTPNCSVPKAVQPSTSNDLEECLKLKPIGVISTWFPSKRGTPRQPGICDTAPGKLTLFNSVFTNPEHALEGLQDFSHMWILFHFHKNDSTHVRAKVAPPRLNGVRTGVFSTRSPHRPSPIGLSLVKIIKIENCTIFFEGVDMVDQTPVLDVKPYIPQYDNPLHVEKYGVRDIESSLVDRELLGNIEDRLRNGTICNIEGKERLTNQSHSSEITNGLRTTLHESHHGNTDGAAQGTDISRDEEIALRLQAEEFDGHAEFGNYLDSRNYYRTNDRNLDIDTSFENGRGNVYSTGSLETIRELSNGLSSDLSLYEERDLTNSEIATQSSVDDARNSAMTDINISSSRNNGIIARTLELDNENMVYSLQHVDLNSQDNRTIAFNSRNIEVNNPNDQISRNTRLLDGADGPSTYIDLIHRRAVNPRPDNSPVRMGVREAPDGEEGFTAQNLTPSQTLPNIQGVAASGISQNVGATQNIRTESRSQNVGYDDNPSDVRIPDWISRPRVSALTVTFNERALIQLNEILGDKADQQKQAIVNVLCQDPRSVYLRQRWANQFYTFLIHELHISCRFDDNRHVVTVFQIRHAGRMCECGEPEWQCLGHSPLT
ncbi:tRNA (adenine(37)-N6)-methyltransferase [Athalia rosae]|uniref:tRNA (adenine(37)-N6)-methyltransferase n=1 Tax=Athalia rosae TaxID=37344 RepID=UPI002033D054|nr:tRNA (adenine(37)-N6)-methyltransferase [Athalia rosae]